jgi:NAD(P)H dehydrogenase (quinone)
MYAIMGITGQIGSVIGRSLLAAKQPVRAVVRDVGKGQIWADRGCEIALANIEDAASLTTAFRGAERVFVLVPPNFDPAPEFPEARAIAAALRTALEAARPARVVYLSLRLGRRPASRTCLPNTRSSRRPSVNCRRRSRSCVRPGSWRTPVGT